MLRVEDPADEAERDAVVLPPIRFTPEPGEQLGIHRLTPSASATPSWLATRAGHRRPEIAQALEDELLGRFDLGQPHTEREILRAGGQGDDDDQAEQFATLARKERERLGDLGGVVV